MKQRKIIHVDMDAFFASVEQRDFPQYRGKPLIVGGSPDKRGVVSTCSYEARKFGIHSAMSSARAVRLCPHGIFVRPRMQAYKEVSEQIRKIFHEYTDFVEPLSLDEAFMDVTENKLKIPYATEMARKIKRQIFLKTGLTASAGVSYNKFLAKVASDIKKPNGLTVVTPNNGTRFIEKLTIDKFFGVGKVTGKKMRRLGIRTGLQLKERTLKELIDLFGKNGKFYYDIARGIDNRQVNPHRVRKSLGSEITLPQDISGTENMLNILTEISEEVEKHLVNKKLKGKTITLKVKYSDFQTVTRCRTLSREVNDSETIMQHIKDLLQKTNAENEKVRLLGISLSNFPNDKKKFVQLEFDFVKMFY
ncbi:MAG: DNA polymerase IV [Verrucomicrobiota bacterium]|nr:DNA polymerase IV [Verrucomicrobiota bacterium]